MKDKEKTKKQLLAELAELRQRVYELGSSSGSPPLAEAGGKKEWKGFKSFLDNLGDLAYEADCRGNITYANKTAEKITGLPLKHIIGKPFWPFFKKESQKIADDVFRRTLQGENPEYELTFRSGIICRFKNEPLRDSDGKIVGVFGIARDITDRRLAEEELAKYRDHLEEMVSARTDELIEVNEDLKEEITERKRALEALLKSEDKFRKVFDNAKDAIFIQTPVGKIVDANRAACSLLGYTREELLSMEVADIVAPEVAANLAPTIRKKTLAEGVYVETEDICKDGTRIPIEASFTLVEIGGEKRVIAVVRDITGRKRAEEELRGSEERFRTVFQSAQDVIFIKDRTLRYTQVNRAMERLFGRPASRLLGRTDEDLFGEEAGAHIREVDARVLAGEIVEEEHTKPVRGVPTTFHIIKVPMRNRSGEIIGLCGIARDVTVRRRMEEELFKTQKLESVGILAGGIAHDFNNILMAILGNVSLSKLEVEPGSKAFRALSEAETACGRAKNLTRQLLTFSRGGKPVKVTVSIPDLLQEAVKFSLSGSKTKCEFSLPEDLWSVEVDPGQMNQVIGNLIINADQAMPAGGIIRAGGENIVVDRGMGLPLPQGRYIRISIKDEGAGIPDKHIDRIFDPYFSTKRKGSGLGLTTAYSITQKHSGLITVESELGVGTTFFIYLPVSGKKLEGEMGVEEKVIPGKGRILLMDDEQPVREVTGEMIKSIGFEVELARDGAETIEIYRKSRKAGQPFDVVILDLTVSGGMGGKETLKNLREIDPGVKAIISSGYSTDSIMAEFEKYNFHAVIAKPFKIKELSEVLYRVTQGQ